jgi:hypothetical protein
MMSTTVLKRLAVALACLGLVSAPLFLAWGGAMSTTVMTATPAEASALRPIAKALLGFTVSTLSLCVLMVALAAL